MKSCLLVIDVQNDFITGSLSVSEAEQIIPIINSIRGKFDVIVFTQDWHPKIHSSFKENGGIWPVHCVRNTFGSEIHKDLIRDKDDIIIFKGVDIEIDSYSAFWDNDKKKSTGLTDILKGINVNRIYVTGLATDYCVKFSALDSVKNFETFLILDTCKGVNIKTNDSVDSVIEMMNKNVKIVTSKNILSPNFNILSPNFGV